MFEKDHATLVNRMLSGEISEEEYAEKMKELAALEKKEMAKSKKKGKTKVVDKQVVKEEEKPAKVDVMQGATFEVFIPEHDMPYKDQAWPVCSRNLTYNVERVANPSRAKDILVRLLGYGEGESQLCTVYECVTYDTITADLKCIGYIVKDNQASKLSTFFSRELLEKKGIKIAAVRKACKKGLEKHREDVKARLESAKAEKAAEA